MFKQGQIVLVTRDWEENNTKGKIGIILDIWGSSYKIGFYDELEMSNEDSYYYKKRNSPIKSAWWVKEHLLKSAVSKNKFK